MLTFNDRKQVDTIGIFTFPSRKKGENVYRLSFPELNELACDDDPQDLCLLKCLHQQNEESLLCLCAGVHIFLNEHVIYFSIICGHSTFFTHNLLYCFKHLPLTQ